MSGEVSISVGVSIDKMQVSVKVLVKGYHVHNIIHHPLHFVVVILKTGNITIDTMTKY